MLNLLVRYMDCFVPGCTTAIVWEEVLCVARDVVVENFEDCAKLSWAPFNVGGLGSRSAHFRAPRNWRHTAPTDDLCLAA